MIDGKCLKMVHDEKTKDTTIRFNRNCSDDTKVAYTTIGEALSGKKGKLILEEDEWEEDN